MARTRASASCCGLSGHRARGAADVAAETAFLAYLDAAGVPVAAAVPTRDGGFGYLAYDLAVHLWAQVSFGRRRHAMWHAFLAGYRSVRTVAPADECAAHLFVPIRHIWLMGEYAGRTAEWGSEVLSVRWLEREVAFLLDWERDRLSPGLLGSPHEAVAARR